VPDISGRRDHLPAAPARNGLGGTRATAQSQFGRPGLGIWGGFVREEYLTELTPWDREVRAYLEMRDDPVIATLLDAIKAPLLKAEFRAVPASDNPADRSAAEFLDENLHGMERQTWRSHVSDMLEALDFGFAIGEVVMERRRGRLCVRNIEPRGQETLHRWVLEGDRVVGFEQSNFRGSEIGAPATLTVPLWKCLHVAYRARKGNPQGKSLLRSLYQPWRYVKNLQLLEGIGVERDVGGMPVFELPPEPAGGDSAEVDRMLANIRMDEQMYVKLPHGAKLYPYGAAKKAYYVREIIAAYQKAMLMRFFAQFLALGMDRVGSQALVEGSQEFFLLGIESVQHELLEAWNQQLVPFLFRWNAFPGRSGLPRLEWASPAKRDVRAVLDAYSSAAASGLLTRQPGDEDLARGLLDLPPVRAAADEPPGSQPEAA
jgi:hypothetical protein